VLTSTRRRLLRRLTVSFVAVSAAAACLTPTPFGTESEATDLNAKNVARLASAPTDGIRLRLVVFGDTHQEYDELARTVRAINRGPALDLVVHLGDQTNQGLLQEYEWEHSVLQELAPPIVFTLGNHDALSNGEAIYRRMYGPLNYAFSHRGYRFVSFNSNTLEFPESAPDRAWLSNAVFAADEPYGVILVTHHSPETSDAPADVLRFYRDLLHSRRVVLWLHGHAGEFLARRIEGVPVLRTGNFHERLESGRVTANGDGFAFERCHMDDCKPVELEMDPPTGALP
jgi:Icc-related predicted phosphoesterase